MAALRTGYDLSRFVGVSFAMMCSIALVGCTSMEGASIDIWISNQTSETFATRTIDNEDGSSEWLAVTPNSVGLALTRRWRAGLNGSVGLYDRDCEKIGSIVVAPGKHGAVITDGPSVHVVEGQYPGDLNNPHRYLAFTTCATVFGIP